HLLLEEAPSAECGVPSPEPIVVGARRSALDAPPAIAVVSMEAHFGPWTSLSAFQERVLGGAPAEPHPPGHWWGVPDSAWFSRQGFGDTPFAGFYVEELSVPAGRFRIPPRELQEMLPQQTLMLQVAEAALARVHVPDELRLRTGAFIGL